ncbi:uncharacterized protein LOC134244415 [Saccostrea cucullata]|uniref:uncharacterized protein LOC134244415 n=1 Tax=Saccostrea cuccullata TaxID=36930 RepID=UPI002ED1F9CA
MNLAYTPTVIAVCNLHTQSDSQDMNNNSTFVPDETLKFDDIDIKTFNDKGVQCDPDPLLEENLALRKELEDLKRERDRHKWSAEKIANDDGKTKYYTGLPSYAVFIWLFNFLRPKAERMRYWISSNTDQDSDRQRV